MPDLWANIYIRPRRSHPVLQFDPVRAWASRSAQLALKLELFCDRYFDTFPIVTSVIFPIKMMIWVRIDETASDWGNLIPPATAFQSCPQLHVLGFMLCGLRLNIADLNAPWHQLTTLQLYMTPVLAYECLDIFCHISILPIDSLALQRIAGLPRYPAVLPSLHTLHLGFSTLTDDNSYFLHALRLPLLRTFLPGNKWDLTASWTWPLPVFRAVLCDTIRELNLSLLSVDESLREVLTLVPNVETLWLSEDCHLYPDLMYALATGAVLPRLTALRLETVHSLFLLDVIKMRLKVARANPGITSFVDVWVLTPYKIPLGEACWAALTETGMRIRFGE
ncbi:hypothetical protein BD779DRAFT_1788893 [Infundibulicybe gibba]|nr:hypothetical protein BD779DRAFT_1788893 [Infundibulicybe gibba]